MQSVVVQSIAAAALLMVCTLPVPAAAQCTGDCSGDNQVTVDELLIGVNIALGVESVTECEPFDVDMSGDVTVDELLAAVNYALNGCPPPTAPTPNPSGVCGDGHVDFGRGETCDDGNTVEGDSCPANCTIHPCTGAGTTVSADVSFTAPAGVDVGGITIFLRYPDGVVRIPGFANDASVQNSITNLPDNAFSTPNDLDYALRLVMFSADGSAIAASPLFTVQFDNCAGAAPPQADDFRCTVETAVDTNTAPVSGATCAVTLR
jgi:cysteine-rich repeat protein